MFPGKNYLILFIVLIQFSCSRRSDVKPQETITYNQLIMNVALNTPYYNYDITRFSGAPTEYEYEASKILHEENSVGDDTLGIQLSLHSWTDGGVFPKSIIYITNHNSVKYAFPFYDEYYYAKHADQIEDGQYKDLMKKMLGLERHLNYIISQLGWSQMWIPDSRKRVNRLVTLLMRDLLHLKEYTAADTVTLRKNLMVDLENFETSNDLCSEKFNENINRIVTDSMKKGTRFFGTKVGKFGVWKISMEYGDEYDRISNFRVSFENSECYTAHFW